MWIKICNEKAVGKNDYKNFQEENGLASNQTLTQLQSTGINFSWQWAYSYTFFQILNVSILFLFVFVMKQYNSQISTFCLKLYSLQERHDVQEQSSTIVPLTFTVKKMIKIAGSRIAGSKMSLLEENLNIQVNYCWTKPP